MMLTWAGLKLWASGMLMLLMSVGLALLMTEKVIDSMSLGELTFIFLVLYPLAIGWVQRWLWTPKSESERDGIEL